jgi:D-3-phosphoglycerate dehydrogenase
VRTDFTESGDEVERETFERAGLDVELVEASDATGAGGGGLAGAVTGADALLVQFAQVDRDVIAALSDCRVISRYGIGVDMIDLVAAAEAGIPVTNVPDYCIDEVSTQTIGFLVDLNRRTVPLDRHVRSGGWGRLPVPVSAPRRLAGQTLGVVGLGAIGREVARKARALGLRVIASDPFAPPDAAAGVERVELAELLERSDYVTLHCPLTDETRGLIGAEELAAMRPTAYLLNLSRGPVVVQAALVRALREGMIAGAALDVLEVEPPDQSEEILALENVLLTPHSASWSVESARQLRVQAAENVVAALTGGELRSVVNRGLLERSRA